MKSLSAFVVGLALLASLSVRAAEPAFVFTHDPQPGASSSPATRIVAASVRSEAGRDDRTLIAGFVIDGKNNRSMLVRGLGPALRPLGVQRALNQPRLTLHELRARQTIAAIADWGAAADPAQLVSTAARLGALPLAANSRDAALLHALPPGVYTANVSSSDDASGIALVEIYDADENPSSRLASIAARSHVGTGEDILILGLAISGESPRQVLVRGIGPTLISQGVNDALADPQLSIYDARGILVASNDNWSDQNIAALSARIGAFPLPENSRDSALLLTLPPGAYTAQVRGANNSTGVALVELYDVPPSARQTTWTMINVSPFEHQADSHLIEFPDGRLALIDAADGGDAPGTLLSFFEHRGIRHLDLVILSHFHFDHYGRLRDLISAGVTIGRVACNLPARGNPHIDAERGWGFSREDAESLLRFLDEKRIPHFTPRTGERLLEVPLGDGTFAALDAVCLYDGLNTPVGPTDTNDTSIIVRLSHGRTRALFTGDLNHALGAWLATGPFDLSAEILKLPHHGTAGIAPPEFFERVGARVAMVPSPKNLWHSPRSKLARDFYAERNIPAFVNGIHGHVTATLTTAGFRIDHQ